MSGDLHVVIEFPDGALVALIDGLGHGSEAAEASRAAAALLERDPAKPIQDLLVRCHEGLRQTRGAVMTLAAFDGPTSTLTWTGVGNVDAVLLRRSGTQAAAPLRAGVVGFQLPPLRVDTVSLSTGDLVIMATDGIRALYRGLSMDHGPQELAESILVRYARPDDDAHVVVVRYLGGAT